MRRATAAILPGALPWESELNLTGGHSITVRAYDEARVPGYERTYRYDASAIRVDLNGRYLDFDQPPAARPLS